MVRATGGDWAAARPAATWSQASAARLRVLMSRLRMVCDELYSPRTAESPFPSTARRQLRHLAQLHRLDALEHQLGDAHSAGHGHRLRSQVDHGDEQLATIVRVDRRRGVGECETVLHGEARPRTDLCFETGRDGEGETSLHQPPRHRRQGEVGLRAADVIARRAVGLARGQRQPVVVREAPDLHHRTAGHTSVLGSVSGRLNASATPGYTTLPSITLSPRNREASALHACFHPSFARRFVYGNVALVSASVEVRGTPPGMFATP